MAEEQEESASPTSWLWQEIEQRFGKQAADDLRQAYSAQLREYNRTIRHKHDLRDLIALEYRRARRVAEGLSTKQLDRSIAIRRQRLDAAEAERKGDDER